MTVCIRTHQSADSGPQYSYFKPAIAQDPFFQSVPPLIWGNMFLPFSKGVAVREGDAVEVNLTGEVASGEYNWTWVTKIRDGEVEFVQSSLMGKYYAPVGTDGKEDDEYIPTLSDEGQLMRRILGSMDGDTELEQIAEWMMAEFPEQLATLDDPMDRVAAASRTYSR